ncbi:MAG: hypothetical protein WD276_06950 [Actinomycetota bacterium]
MALNAFGESLSPEQVEAGLAQLGSMAQDSITVEIRVNARKVARETNVRALINGDANKAQDALAKACNSIYPI